MKKLMFMTSLLLFLLKPCMAMTIDKIIMFGDSLSDTGNVYALTLAAHKIIPQIPIIPKQPPYYQGRFSNGPVWVEAIASSMNVPLLNYAYAGSWAESIKDSKWNMPFGLNIQVDAYLTSAVLDFNKDKHLYIIWSGANDYIDGRDDPDYATSNTVANIQAQIDSLAYHGAKHIAVINLPDVSVIPEVAAKGPDFAAAVSHLIKLHNLKLTEMLTEENKAYPDLQLINVDVESHFNDILSDPARYQLKNVTQACYDGGYALSGKKIDLTAARAAKQINIDLEHSPSLRIAYLVSQARQFDQQICPNPDEYLFWDQVHPTRVAHALISNYILTALQENNVYS